MAQQVYVLIGTTKGLFTYHSDIDRRDWKLSGPFLPGWELYSVLGDSRHGQRIFAGTQHCSGGATIQISEDFGAIWHPVALGPRFSPDSKIPLTRFWQIVAGPDAQPDTYYAGTEDAGLFVSHDRGET